MSHFTVLVIGDDPEAKLAPFHEFECTGDDNEYVQDVDITEEAREKYLADTTRRLRAPDGSLFCPYDDRCYREPTPEESKEIGPGAGTGGSRKFSWASKDWGDGRGYRTKIRFVPSGYEEITLPTSETQTFAEFIENYYGLMPLAKEGDHKYGWIVLDANGDVVRAVDRTNPNAKWDWYQIGGRWTGFFKLRDRAKGVMGSPSLLMDKKELMEIAAKNGHNADQARKRDVDFDAMRAEKEAQAARDYDQVKAILDQYPDFLTWEQMRGRYGDDIEQARTAYHAQPTIRLLREAKIYTDADDYLIPREEFLRRARDAAGRTFAVIKDGQWYEKGEMGWWGAVSGEKDADEWTAQYQALMDSLHPDTLLTVVDCHI